MFWENNALLLIYITVTQLSARALGELVLEDAMLLPSKDMYVGQEADAFRRENPKHAVSSLHKLTGTFFSCSA